MNAQNPTPPDQGQEHGTFRSCLLLIVISAAAIGAALALAYGAQKILGF